MNFWSIVYVILLYNTFCAISCQQQWQKKGKTNVIYGYATISIEIQKGMLFRKKFPAITYSLGSSSRQLPPPLSCLQCYLHYSNWRLQVRVAFLHLTSSRWISGAAVLLWVKFVGWDFRCWCSALGFPGIILQLKLLLQDEEWAQVSWEIYLY